jgi:hypothetical protein
MTERQTDGRGTSERIHRGTGGDAWRASPKPPADSPGAAAGDAGAGRRSATASVADRFVEEQLFEEDVRAVLGMMRPHRRERLLGWAEHRTGGTDFRATISWDPSFGRAPQSPDEQKLAVPRMVDVLATILVGSVKDQDELTAAEEFHIYRGIIRDLYFRIDEMQSCYE